jgi:molecular chaperone GrpE (heat shock protein)
MESDIYFKNPTEQSNACEAHLSDSIILDNYSEDERISDTEKSEHSPETNNDWREELIDKFASYVYELSETDFDKTKENDSIAEDNIPDLFSFYSQLASLKTEISLQSKVNQKSGTEMLHSLKILNDDLTNQGESLREATVQIKSQIPKARKEAQETVIIEFISIMDALKDAIEINKNSYRIPGYPWTKKYRNMIFKIHKSQKMFLAKIEDVLRRFNVLSVVKIGDSFDAGKMRVIDTEDGSDTGSKNIVSKIFRQGYIKDNKLIQIAEVQITR